MADKSKDKNKPASAFTPREQEIMAIAWQCFEGEPKVNYKKLAALLGMENPVSASNAWSKIKKKLAAQAGDVVTTTTGNGEENDESTMQVKATPSKKATPKRKKASAVAKDGENGDEGEEAETPTKKGKTAKAGAAGKGKKGKQVKEEAVEDEVGDVVDGEVKMEEPEMEEEDSAFV